MSNDYITDKVYEEQRMPTVKAILASTMGMANRPATKEEDQIFATDIVAADGTRIGCRVRRAKYWENEDWRRQFTIRWDRESGAVTEFEKVVEQGKGDMLFYGFGKDEKSLDIPYWNLLSLDVFRKEIAKHEMMIMIRATSVADDLPPEWGAVDPGDLIPQFYPEVVGIPKPNPNRIKAYLENNNDSTSFLAFYLDAFPKELVIKTSGGFEIEQEEL
jgi:hypothetical protein